MKERIDPFEYSAHILSALKTGVLLTTRGDKKLNTMVIGWGMLGIEWGLPIFITYVRTHRYTHLCLEENPEFTVNVPISAYDKQIISVAGTKSGRDLDKIKYLGLHPVQPERISVPGILEFPLTLECQIIYAQHQNGDIIPHDLRAAFYPAGKDPYKSVLNGDFHTAYYGAIADAYIIKE